MRTLLTLAAIATALTSVAGAESREQTSSGKPSVTIGGGVVIKPDYSGADTYDTIAIPVISAKKEITPGNTIYLQGFQAGLDHAIDDQLSVGAVLSYRGKRDSSDSSRLTGMNDIDAALEVGPKVRYQVNQQFGIVGTALFDVTDAHDGYTARVGADYALPLTEITMLTLSGGLNYGSDDYNNTYYGVRTNQVAPGRPAYKADAGFTNVDLGVGVRHALTNNWALTGRLGADYLLGDSADSPLVDQEVQPSLMLGVAYKF